MVDNKPNNLVIYDKIILIIEGIDHFIDPLTNQEAIVAFWLPRFFPKRVRIIITGDKASNSYKYFFNGLGVDLEAQVDNESTMFSIENEPLASSTVVNFEPPAQQLQHPPLQTNLLRQIVPEKLPSPIPMRIQLPKNRLFPGQTILMRRPDGTLVQVVVQRQPLQQQRQMIAQPARQVILLQV